MLKRIISRLDIKNNSLVKGVQLEGLRVLGDPKVFAEKYFNDEADEIHYQDIVASLYGRNTINSLLEETVKNIFIPVSVGGGIKSIEQIRSLLASGADKVTINSEAVRNPDLITKTVQEFGSSTISLGVEVIKSTISDDYNILIESGREKTTKNLKAWVEKAQTSGVGEIILTSIDNDGLRNGFDLNLVKYIENYVNVPLLIHGGCSSYQDVYEAFSQTSVSGVIISSVLHYSNLDKAFKSNNTGNMNFINSTSEKNDNNFSIKNLKNFLLLKNIKVRSF